jgi:tetratricopeptide (TPR) repeat protein
LLISHNLLIAQNWNQIFSKELEAEFYLYEKRYEEAALKYQEALELIPRSANITYKIGFSYLLTSDKKEQAIKYLEEAANNVSKDYDPRAIKEITAPPEVFYYLGKAYQITKQFDLAKDAYKRYREFLDPLDEYSRRIDMLIAQCNIAPQYIEDKKGLKERNLGATINENNPNFNAVISGDGKTIAFTRHLELGYEVHIAKKEGDSWGEPKSIASNLRAYFLKTSSISYDGTELYLIDDFTSDGLIYYSRYDRGSIYYSRFENGEWTKVKKLKKPINSKFNDSHATISSDGQTLYFASDRPGGVGGIDIYKSTLSSKGKWGNPENLGTRINTEYNEDTPFLTPDGKYLFFSSEGHNSIGGYDIFYAEMNSSKSPVNIGYPLNDTDDNLFFFPNDVVSGFTAYYDPDGYGSKDIMFVKVLPLINLLGIISTDKGSLSDFVTDVNVSIYSFDDKKVEAEIAADRAASSFSHRIMPGSYQVTLQGEGFNDFIAEVSIPEDYDFPNYTLDVLLKPIVQEPSLAVVEESNFKESEIEMLDAQFVEEETESSFEKDKEKESPSRNVTIEPKIAFVETSSLSEDSYTVQIMALIVPVDIEHFANISGVSVVKGSDGFHRYTVGSTKTREEAKIIQQQLVALGYKDAFVRKAIFSEATSSRFAIQIMALRNPVEVGFFANLSDVIVSHDEDGLYRYFYGSYSSLEQAKQDLPRIKELGYMDAFVRRIEQ